MLARSGEGAAGDTEGVPYESGGRCADRSERDSSRKNAAMAQSTSAAQALRSSGQAGANVKRKSVGLLRSNGQGFKFCVGVDVEILRRPSVGSG